MRIWKRSHEFQAILLWERNAREQADILVHLNSR